MPRPLQVTGTAGPRSCSPTSRRRPRTSWSRPRTGRRRRAWQEAAQRAHLDFANTDAERLLGHALGCAGKAGDRTVEGKIHLRRAQVRHDLGHLAEAKRDCEAAIAIARELGDEDLEAHALEQLGWTALCA